MAFEQLFSPRGVAVIGASRNPTKLGYGVARNLVRSGYAGGLYFVNPLPGQLFDRPVYTDVASVPDPVDLAVVIIPAEAVPGAIEACGERGIKMVIVCAGGFRETGPEGAALEARCMEIAGRYGLRILGPNCIGYLDTHLPIDTTFLPLPGPIPGDIAFLSHSGAICEAVIDWARGQGFGLSRLVSLGNQMDLTESDLLLPVANDPNTRVVVMYLEGVEDGRAFVERARAVTRAKPVVAIKVGRSASGRAAVASHTGAMAGQDVAYSAAFRKAGVIRSSTSEETFDWARALAWCPLPGGRRMAVLTNAGGPGAIAVDALEANGLDQASLSLETVSKLRTLLPSAANVHNPVDMLASAGSGEYAGCLSALLEDDGVDGVMVILPPPPMSTAAEVAGAIIPLIRSTTKPVVVALMGEELIAQAARLFRQAHVPDYRFPERAATALKVLAERAEQLASPEEADWVPDGIDAERVRKLMSTCDPSPSGFVGGSVAAEILRGYGLKCAPQAVVGTAEEAVSAAHALGFPVALKVESAEVTHKSDIGGVVLELADDESVADAFAAVTRSVGADGDVGREHRALVQRMVDAGQEVILGMVRDAQFGPLVMFGSGGVEVEGLNDVAFALAPLSRAEADRMMESTWAGRRLRGYRNIPPGDREAVLEALVRLGQLGMDNPQVMEVEVNPLRVYPVGQGAVVLDARLRLDRA
ncbi:MAG TPA: acetate--CoA ligase family protein [Anaerolineales bacterium]|nr:acetate--CoA ligase family protein [Anaerolineales bacterium]